MIDSASANPGAQQHVQDSAIPTISPVIDEVEDQVGPRSRTLTRVSWRGWTVHVLDGAVTVPRQDSTGKSIADLAMCLRAAYGQVEVTDRMSGPTTGLRGVPRDPELRVAVDRVVAAAAQIAAPLRRCDIYGCLRTAWQDDDMRVPFAAVLATVRAALPANTTLSDFGDTTPGSEHIVALLQRAAQTVVRRVDAQPDVAVGARSA